MKEREKAVRDKILFEDSVERRDTAAIREAVLDYLINFKGYLPEDIEKDIEFEVSSGNIKDTVSTDFIISISGKRFLAVKCAATALSSRERHIVSFCRVVDSYQIPFCLLTDSESALLIDTVSGKTVSEKPGAIPSRADAVDIIGKTVFMPCPPERLDKERRILLAFQSATCPAE